MGLFNKKNKGANEVAAPADTGKGKAGKKKAKDGMASVFSESVVEAAIDDFSTAGGLDCQHNGESMYVGLHLNTETIGGFSKACKKDEDKGCIVELINKGSIKTLITESLMEQECIVFIPDTSTLSLMDEFGILTSAEYELCYVSSDGEIELSGVSVTFEQVAEHVGNDGAVSDLLPEEDDDFADDLADNVEQEYEEDEGSQEFDDLNAGDDDMPFASGDDGGMGDYQMDSQVDDRNGAEYGQSQDDADYDDNSGDYNQQDDYDGGYDDSGYDDRDSYNDGDDYGDGEDEYDDGEPEEDEVEIPNEMVFGTITRAFYSDDLGLEISTAPFDAQFIHTNPHVAFVEERGEGWLNGYLSQMARDANTELRRMHQDNLFKMRERYLSLMQDSCQMIIMGLDPADETTEFGKLHKTLKNNRDSDLEDIDTLVGKRKEMLEADWEAKLEQVGQDAANEAKQKYRERHSRQHSEDLFRLQAQVREEIEAKFMDSVRAMNDERRVEAARMLDISIHETLHVISGMYAEALEGEAARYKELQDKMLAFADDNRKYEIARVNTLSAELAQNQRAEAVETQYQMQVQTLQAEFETRNAALRADIEALRQRNRLDLEARENELTTRYDDMVARYEARVGELSDNNATLQNRIGDLLVQIAHIDENKNREYAARIAQLEDERISWENKCNHTIAVHKKANIITILLATVAVIAGIAIGFIAGEYINIRNDTQDLQSAIIDEFNDRMDGIENAVGENEN